MRGWLALLFAVLLVAAVELAGWWALSDADGIPTDLNWGWDAGLYPPAQESGAMNLSPPVASR